MNSGRMDETIWGGRKGSSHRGSTAGRGTRSGVPATRSGGGGNGGKKGCWDQLVGMMLVMAAIVAGIVALFSWAF